MEHIAPLAQMIGFAGINADFIPEKLPREDSPAYLTDGESVIIKDGKIHKLNGVEYLNGISAPMGTVGLRRVLGLHTFTKDDLTRKLMAFTPGSVYYLASTGASWTKIGDLGGADDSILSFANIDDTAVFVMSEDGIIHSWDGTTYKELVDSDLIKARYVLSHKTWLFLLSPTRYDSDGGVWRTEDYQAIWPSVGGDIDDFDEEDLLTLTASGAINGGRRLEDEVIVYFPEAVHRVYLISDTEGFGHRPITEQSGLMAARTLTGSIGQHFYLSQKGMMSLSIGSMPTPLSWSKFNKLIVDGIDPLYYGNAVARYYEGSDLLYVAFPPSGSQENGTLLIYSVNDGELVGKKTLLSSQSYSAFGLYEKDLSALTATQRKSYSVGGVPIIGTTEGRVIEQLFSECIEMGSPFESSVTFPPLFCGDRDRSKRVLQADLFIEKKTDDDITFELEISNEANEDPDVIAYTVTGSGNAGIRRYPVDVDVFGKEFRVVVRDSDNAKGFALHGIILRGYVSTLK